MPAVIVRPRQRFPPHTEQLDTVCWNKHYITIKHPCYDELENDLLVLCAPDSQGGGLQAGFALIACGIVTANRFDGFLSSSRAGEPLDLAEDNILLPGTYYFHVPHQIAESGTPSAPGSIPQPTSASTIYKYPVVPRFQDWIFPRRGSLPPSWEGVRDIVGKPENYVDLDSNIPNIVASRDGTCRMTMQDFGFEKAHLLPQAEQEWMTANGQALLSQVTYIPASAPINTPANMMLLRSDLHNAFDKQEFVMVPKKGRVVTHVLTHHPQLIQMHHNIELQPVDVAVEFLFARLAWSIFPALGKRFLAHGRTDRLVTQLGGEPFDMSISDCLRLIARQTESRTGSPEKSASPTQRRRAEEQNDIEERGRSCIKKIRAESNTDRTVHPPMTSPGSGKAEASPQPSKPKTDTSVSSRSPSSLPQHVLEDMRAKALAKERQRNNADEPWAEELEWLSKHRYGPFSSPEEYFRVVLAEGGEVLGYSEV